MKKSTTGKIQQKHSNQSSFGFFKVAAKKVAGILGTLLFWKRKTSSKGLKQIAVSYSSAGSSSSKSQLRSSETYGSSKGNFSIEEILKATNNFSAKNILGEGGFGTVYKATLRDGSIVAVKRAKKDKYDRRLFAEFKNEVLTLSQIEHMNLVRLFGYLEHGEELIIVVEYVNNGTLREHLDALGRNELGIAERMDIAIDVAHAITYLHMYTDRPIIHRDIKPSNILITEKLRAKVADFGCARLTPEDAAEATHISTQVKGTIGYLDPEYLKTYQLTEKSDVYSFGIVLIELVTGRLPTEPNKPLKETITSRWAMQKLKEGNAIMAMDPRINRNPASVMAVEKVLRLARQCIAPERQSRPSMKQCCEVLWRIRKEFIEKKSSHGASASYQSENIDARRDRRETLGIEDSDNQRFRSA